MGPAGGTGSSGTDSGTGSTFNALLVDQLLPPTPVPVDATARWALANRIAATMPFPYSDLMLKPADVRALFRRLEQMEVRNIGGVFPYSPADYDINRITDYFNERCRMQCSFKGAPTPLQLWSDPAFVAKLLAPMPTVSSHLLREALWRNARECTLFKATVVRSCIGVLRARNVLDISAGWGDRLIGALAAGVERYTAFDPNLCLREGHDKIREFFDPRGTATVHYQPFETGMRRLLDTEPSTHRGAYDLVLSSPPYFDLEAYSPDATQSHLRYPKFHAWLHGFLFVCLRLCVEAVRPGGDIIIDMDDSSGKTTVKPMLKFMATLPDVEHRGELQVAGHSGKPRPMQWFSKRR